METKMDNSFTLRNFYIDNHRTSLRIDAESSKILNEICELENIAFTDLMIILEEQRALSEVQMSRTAYLRIFIIHYLRRPDTMKKLLKKTAQKASHTEKSKNIQDKSWDRLRKMAAPLRSTE